MKRTIALAALPIVALAVAACGATKYVTTTATQTTSTTVTSTTTHTKVRVKRGPPITTTETTTNTITASSPAYQPSSSGQSFSGADSENMGTIHVHQPSELYWSCAGCASSNFIVNNSDASLTITVNSLNATSGKTYLDAGTYHDVTVEGSGPWTVSIHPG